MTWFPSHPHLKIVATVSYHNKNNIVPWCAYFTGDLLVSIIFTVSGRAPPDLHPNTKH